MVRYIWKFSLLLLVFQSGINQSEAQQKFVHPEYRYSIDLPVHAKIISPNKANPLRVEIKDSIKKLDCLLKIFAFKKTGIVRKDSIEALIRGDDSLITRSLKPEWGEVKLVSKKFVQDPKGLYFGYKIKRYNPRAIGKTFLQQFHLFRGQWYYLLEVFNWSKNEADDVETIRVFERLTEKLRIPSL